MSLKKTPGLGGIAPRDQRLDYFKMRLNRKCRTASQQDHSFGARHVEGTLPQFWAQVMAEHLRSRSMKEID